MKMHLAVAATVALLAGSFSAHAYDSLEDLLADLEKQQAAALRQYVQEHPDAPDRGEAEDRLGFALVMMGAYDEAIELQLKKYERVVKDQGAEMGELFGMSIVPIVQTYVQAGRVKEGRAFLARVKEDLGDRANDETVAMALEQLGEGLQLPAVGEAIDLKFTALDGTEVDVSAMKDKVVLVDFWATWCMPCMQDLPSVKALYDELHDKGFEIVGISLDEDRADLDGVIKEEGITWPQAFDGKGWETELAAKFGIQSIPTTILLGKDGKVAAVNLRGRKLREKVVELLGAETAPK
jgi:thiol-disulfide isomerase/thioredoxin